MKYIIFIIFLIGNRIAMALPPGFVYLRDIDPTIQQDIRYDTDDNFIGRPIRGYKADECILTMPAALALAKVQNDLRKKNLSLKVYDCYRPQRAVDDFIQWSRQPQLQQMKAEYYPRVDKEDFFKLGYLATKSGHTRGSTVDITIVPRGAEAAGRPTTLPNHIACFMPYQQRFNDGSIDMGTNFDCLDVLSHEEAAVDKAAYHNRRLLKDVMEKYGFAPYKGEWWHFTLNNEPYPHTYFNFPVTARLVAKNTR